MAITKEQKLAQEIFAECEKEGEPVTMEEALEMAKMEMSAKEERRYEQSVTKERKPSTKVRKVDEEKLTILTALKETLTSMAGIEITECKTETEIHFSLNGEVEYTLKLVKHRPPKK